MTPTQEESILIQQQALQKGAPILPVVRSCRVGDGILSLPEEEQERLRTVASSFEEAIHFFIPASGSGSRMFAFLEEYLAQPSQELAEKAERFFSRLPEFALYRKLPAAMQNAYQTGALTLSELIYFLLNPAGLNYGQKPKALIPFHIHEPVILNAFQEHLLQNRNLTKGPIAYHFTIQDEFKAVFLEDISSLSALTSSTYDVTFSSQNKDTNAFVFDANQALVKDEHGQPLRRPAGHGALLQNLAALNAPYILSKNIDNMQHFAQKQASRDNWQVLLGLQIELRAALRAFVKNEDLKGFAQWNQKIGLFDAQAISSLSKSEWIALLNRPLRVCGMVRNNGQPGGGPFYMEYNGMLTKQIVEKVQLTSHPNASQLLLQSAYFNPVLMVLSPCNLQDEPHDLSQFADPSSYLIVEKNHRGKAVGFIEQPGLWNGAMAHWNTLFVEVPSAAFSPVKTVLDLLDFAHQTNKGA
jgi:hypothetical protein